MSNTGKQSGCLLIGNAQSITQLRVMADLSGNHMHVVGSVAPSQSPLLADYLGNFDDLPELLKTKKPVRALLSLPIGQAAVARQLAELLDEYEVNWQFIPTAQDLLNGTVNTPIRSSRATDVAGIDIARLINRKAYPLKEDEISHVITDRVVMISGAGGSIGSELARIVARFKPGKLVLLERSENALFEIKRQLTRLFPDVTLAGVLHDVANAPRTMHVVGQFQPNVIFHAAAHKHVPVMEEHPAEAIENNFYGTRSLADAAAAHACDRFVMISTDKAVNPTSVMGASKRLAELYIQWLNARCETTFAMVRFGNVLGSACSVLPIWAHQIAHGHPVTVTDARMTRYFMTIPEAAGLVIQSAAYVGRSHVGNATTSGGPGGPGGAGGEVFLLDMGEPVNILELAQRFIRLNGLEPNRDVPIQITGARRGEKLFEELAYDTEGMLPTPHDAIRIWRTTPPEEQRMAQIINLFDALRKPGDTAGHPWQNATDKAVLSALRFAVPEMQPSLTEDSDQTVAIRAAS